MIRVLIADDHELIREGLKKVLVKEAELILAGEAADAAGLFTKLRYTRCDVLILDINLPDRNGMDVLKELRSRYPDIKVLILSMYPEEQYAGRMIRSGASGYFTKGNASEDLLKAIKKVYRGERYVSPAFAEKLAIDFLCHPDKEPHAGLSDREYQVLLLLGMGKSVHDIAVQLHLSVNTIHTYRRRIFGKTDLHTNADIMRYVMDHNLRT